MKKILINSSDRIGYLLLFFIEIVYASNYFNNTFPLSEGWFVNYVNLINDGYVPYKDFYYYLPPLGLAIDWIFWKLSFGFLILFRGWYLIQRILIYFIMYYLLKKEYSWRISLAACTFAEVLCTADAFDFFGDYNQTVVLLGELLIVFFLKLLYSENLLRQRWYSFFCGVIFGMMFLCKQTIFISGFFIMLGGYVLFWKIKNQNRMEILLLSMLGYLFPVLGVFVMLWHYDALGAFFQQVFMAEGKGNIIDVLLINPIKIFKYLSYWVMAIVMYKVFYSDDVNWNEKNLKFLALLMLLMLLDFFGIKKFVTLIFTIFCSWKLDLIMAILLFGGWKIGNHLKINGFDRFWTIYMCVTLLCVCTMFSKKVYHMVFSINLVDVINSKFFIVLFYFFVVVFLKRCIDLFLHNNLDRCSIHFWIIGLGGGMVCYASLMSLGSPIIPASSMRILFPMILAMIFSFGEKHGQKIIRNMIGVFCGFLLIVCIAQKSMSPYPWWGMVDVPKEERIYDVDNRAMSGIKVSKDEKIMIEGITNIINTYSNYDDIVLGYPYIKMFNVLTDRRASYFVPVLWYDVVSDYYVDISTEEVINNPPKIIIWKKIPNAIEAHEHIYRKGKPLRHREFEDVLEDLIDDNYALVEEYDDINVFVRCD